eukprot:TRINITY_DN7005_c0_g1_i2.p1 TRINITY_DN7005_c0_g1~~TRINITY_DN7005_c0_g1_i2.p1  ORF type:complete len:305 (-),score=49.52 TRINITY_DN7005_c0_g1_i2:290-1204(-)
MSNNCGPEHPEDSMVLNNCDPHHHHHSLPQGGDETKNTSCCSSQSTSSAIPRVHPVKHSTPKDECDNPNFTNGMNPPPSFPSSIHSRLPSPPLTPLPPHPSSLLPPSPETIIIFDWDDTLLASTFLSSEGFRLDSGNEEFPAETLTQLKLLENSVILLLNLALQIGHTRIITNAEIGWVQLSAKKFIPGVLPLLNKIVVVSARSTYECFYPEAPNQWKLHAFSEQIKDFADMKKNVISFGDSQAERQAVRAVTKELSDTTTKSIKFVERPSIQQLQRQLEVVTEHFHFICDSQEDLDLMLTLTS